MYIYIYIHIYLAGGVSSMLARLRSLAFAASGAEGLRWGKKNQIRMYIHIHI